MIYEVYILRNRESRDFSRRAGKYSACFLGVVSYHHELVIELRKYCFDSFPELFVCPSWRSPIFLIQPIRYLKGDISPREKILLDFSIEIPLVSKKHTIGVIPPYVLKKVDVMDICRCHVVGMYYASYPTDCMEFISEIVQLLRCAISPCRGRLCISVRANPAMLGPCVLAYFYWLGIYREDILASVHLIGYGFSDFLPSNAVFLRRALNCRRLIRFGISSLTASSFLNGRFSLSIPAASAVMESAITSRSENLGTTLQRTTLSYIKLYKYIAPRGSLRCNFVQFQKEKESSN